MRLLILFLLLFLLTAVPAFAKAYLSNQEPLQFSQSCEPGQRITIAATGDILLHEPLQVQGLTNSLGYFSLWQKISSYLKQGDMVYGNLEGPVATGVGRGLKLYPNSPDHFDNNVLTDYPAFNYHPRLIEDLLSGGFTVVSTANNHALDRSAVGIDLTIANLQAQGLPFTGTRVQNVANGKDDVQYPWFTITQAKGIRVAWLSCAMFLNGIDDRKFQVLSCARDHDAILSIVKQLASNRQFVDAVIVTPHWGDEYQPLPNPSQIRFAHEVLEAGALAVIGNHPHVLEPWDKYLTHDNRETFVIYSLGNFVSAQNSLPTRSSMILYLGLTRKLNGEVIINGVRDLPIFMNSARISPRKERGREVEPADQSQVGSLTLKYVETYFAKENELNSQEQVKTSDACPR